MERSLVEGTRGVQAAPTPPPDGGGPLPFAADTAEAVRNGALYAAVAAIDRVTREVRGRLGRGLRCLLTGGDAERLRPLLAARFDRQPELVLKGLAVMAEEQA
jgi:type III pantothenate kinase